MRQAASRRRITRSVRADGGWLQRVLEKALADSEFDSQSSYTEQVKTLLRDAIVGLRLPPGTPLSELIIANCLGVSRTPVREAVRDLAAEGWLEIYPQAATIVAPIRLSLIEQGSFARNALESANLLDLADRLTEEGRKAIDENMEQQAAALVEHRWDDFYELDDRLHRLFFEQNRREAVWQLVQQGKRHVDRVRRLLMYRSDETCARAHREHREIVAALFDGRKADLARHLGDHIFQLAQHVDAYAEKMESNIIVE